MRRLAAAGLAFTGLLCLCSARAGAVSLGGDGRVGQQSDGSYLTSTNQHLTPSGKQVGFPGRPVSAVLTRAGTAIVLVARHASSVSALNGDDGALVVVDISSGTTKQVDSDAAGSVSQEGIVLSPDGGTVWSSTGGSSLDATTVKADGTLGGTRSVALRTDPKLGSIQPTGLVMNPDGTRLFVSLNRLNAVAELDATTGRELARTKVGIAPRSLVLQGTSLWVAEEGGPPPELGDPSNQSTGSAVTTDRYTGAAATGSVALIDTRTHRVVTHVQVRRHPSALAISGRYLFVADTGDDAVSVIDTATHQVVSTFSTVPHPGLSWGSAPNAIQDLPDGRVLVSLGRVNAVGVWQWRGPTRPVALQGLLPTGWYPTDVQVDAERHQLLVVNDKGVGSLAAGSTVALPDGSLSFPSSPDSPRRVQAYQGTVSLVPVPTAEDLARGASQVATNNGWQASDRACPRTGVAPKAVPERLGEPSLIKHVVYVIKENRTYDQILGDDPRGDGLPALTEFPAANTPNHHLLATQFPLLDNFYDSGSLSADGHQWAMQGDTSDYLERQFGSFSRSYPDQGFDSLDYLPGGFLWEAALAAGKTVLDFGEYTNEDGQNPPQHSDIPSLQGLLVPGYSGFNLQIRDTARAAVFTQYVDRWTRTGSMPDLTLMALPQDHTGGTAPGVDTPTTAVADNDDALGRIVHAISTSPFWKDTAIFVEEDDPQAGLDHVDGHRSLLLAVSPFAKHGGYVDHSYFTQVNVLRTIEQILGITPLNELDQAAEPMSSLFTDTPTLAPYTNVEGSQPAALNPAVGGLSGAQRAWAVWASRAISKGRDGADPNLLERDIWYSTHGWVTPFPGDRSLLLPGQVPASGGLLGLAHAAVAHAAVAQPRRTTSDEDQSGGRASLLVRTAGRRAVQTGCAVTASGPSLGYGETALATHSQPVTVISARPAAAARDLAATGANWPLTLTGGSLLACSGLAARRRRSLPVNTQ